MIGDRPRDEIMPPLRRLANAVSTWALSLVVRRRLRDSQNGMRLFRASALRAVPPPPGRYEAETRHLKALIRSGRDIAWVPMPAVYAGEPSSFRAVADTLRVMRAVLAPAAPRSESSVRGVLHEWLPRIGLAMLLAWTVAAALPVLGGLDEQLFLAVNGLGDGPEWLYQALDPHGRNYMLLAAVATLAVLFRSRSLRFAAGATVAMLLAGVFADSSCTSCSSPSTGPAPRRRWGRRCCAATAATGATSRRSRRATSSSPPRSWRPRPRSRRRCAASCSPTSRAIAVTRMTFGAHFPLDVMVGAVIGTRSGASPPR